MYFLVGFLACLAINEVVPQTVKTTYVCPTGFQSIGRKCYYFGKQPVIWTDSHFYCGLLNSTLVIFRSYREQNLLKGFVTQDNHTTLDSSERWIDGIYDWKTQHWKWGANAKPIRDNPFTKRNTGEKFRWNCLALNGALNNRWLARKCTEKKGFICETDKNIIVEFKLYNKQKKKFNITRCTSEKSLDDYEKRRCRRLLGRTEDQPSPLKMRNHTARSTPKKRNFDGWICSPHMINLGNRCYIFSTKESTWTDAHFECRRNGTKLAIIRNKSQDHNLRMFLNNFIATSSESGSNLNKERHDRWIGGIYDWKTTKWRWAMNGQPLMYRGFNSKVMHHRTPEDLAWNSIFMDPKMDNQWNAAKQTEKKRFICQVQAKAVKKFVPRRKRPADATINIVKNHPNAI
ncbi:uncharacterized protein [Diabrotica undecimpunctata]|uniref:uncharacterized protein isoform X1 n=1 Tax=Diabrotica undecimpunctata TaxID=50387 RepID=UPI003B635EA9